MRMIRGLARGGVAAAGCLLVAGLTVPAAGARAGVAPGPGIPTPGYSGQLNAVTCTPGASGQCWAVGSGASKPDYGRNAAYRWTGSQWVAASVPQPTGRSQLNSVSCPAASGCLAVGVINGTTPEVLRWNGSAWSQISAPAAGGLLAAVSCLSMSNCEAVTPVSATHWNGTSWSTPYDFPSADVLSGVTCVSGTNCWIAGYRSQGSGLDNLILHGSGSSWTQEQVPQPGSANAFYNYVNDIACVSAADCWAGGDDLPAGDDNNVNELLHWDGSAWSLVTSPVGPKPDSQVNGVTCVNQTDCWAVGTAAGRPEALHWNGTAWSVKSTSIPGGTGQLAGVRCLSRTSCFAAGSSGLAPHQNLVLRWNGSAWSTS